MDGGGISLEIRIKEVEKEKTLNSRCAKEPERPVIRHPDDTLGPPTKQPRSVLCVTTLGR